MINKTVHPFEQSIKLRRSLFTQKSHLIFEEIDYAKVPECNYEVIYWSTTFHAQALPGGNQGQADVVLVLNLWGGVITVSTTGCNNGHNYLDQGPDNYGPPVANCFYK